MDLRVKKTYAALIEACTKLLSERRYEEMSVATLCEEAMIRRTTFYKHFADKSEFFAFYVESLRAQMVERGHRAVQSVGEEADEASERRAVLHEFADYLLEHEALMDNIFASSLSGVLLDVICEKVADAFYGGAVRHLPSGTPASPDLLERADFAAGGVVRGMLRWWNGSDRAERRDDFVDLSATLSARILDE